jgi:hypothetical protein
VGWGGRREKRRGHDLKGWKKKRDRKEGEPKGRGQKV